MGDLAFEFEDTCLRVATVDNLQLAAWFGPPDMNHMRTIDRVYKRLKRRVTGGVVFTNVVVSGVPRFTAEVREEAARQTADADENDLATCHLILVDGLTGTTVRAFMSTVMLMGRPPHPTKVFGDIPVASRWLSEQLSRNEAYSWNASRLTALISEVAVPLQAEA